jgi:cytochrome c5
MEEAAAKPVETKVEVAAAPADDNKKGEEVYKSACFACHEAGVAGSPKIGDKEAWVARIATGNDALYTSAISGKGIMPPKGGNMGLSDDDVKAAVDYMTANSQ